MTERLRRKGLRLVSVGCSGAGGGEGEVALGVCHDRERVGDD